MANCCWKYLQVLTSCSTKFDKLDSALLQPSDVTAIQTSDHIKHHKVSCVLLVINFGAVFSKMCFIYYFWLDTTYTIQLYFDIWIELVLLSSFWSSARKNDEVSFRLTCTANSKPHTQVDSFSLENKQIKTVRANSYGWNLQETFYVDIIKSKQQVQIDISLPFAANAILNSRSELFFWQTVKTNQNNVSNEAREVCFMWVTQATKKLSFTKKEKLAIDLKHPTSIPYLFD